MTADSKWIKTKKSHHPLMTFLKIGSRSYPIFRIFIHPPLPPPLKIYVTIFAYFSVFSLEHFEIFWMFFFAVSCFCYRFFLKIFPYFYDQIKHKAGNRFYLPTKNNKPIETLQIKQSYRTAQLLWSQNLLVVYTHWL